MTYWARIRFIGQRAFVRQSPLGTVYVAGKNVNAAMVEDGFAWQYVQYSRDKRLMILEHDAREFKRGLWADPEPVPPWKWRRRKNP